jgi:ubiquinol-cytochrome c reductase iron-sulfur subunit
VSDEQRTPVAFSVAKAEDPHMQPKARNPKRTEALLALVMLLGIGSMVGFVVAYFVNAQSWIMGALMGAGALLLGFGITAWGKYLMPQGPFVEERHRMSGTAEQRARFKAAVVQRGGGILGRRKVLAGLAGAGMGIFGLLALVPVIRSFGPLPGNTLDVTQWKRGTKLVDASGRGIHVSDVAVGGVVTVFPEGMVNTDNGQAVDQTILIRLTTQDFTTRPGRESWGPAGYVAYSKLCTHLGCPVGLYEQQLQLLVCPCHQSMFDVANGAEPNFGPAPRPLPQLALFADSEGFLRAQGPYDQPVGPGYWTRS